MSRWELGTLTSLPASLTFYKNSLTGKHLISSYKAFTLGHKVQFLFSLSHLPPSSPAPMGHSVTHPCLFLYYHLSTQLSVSHHLPIHPYFNVSRTYHPLIRLSSVIYWSIHVYLLSLIHSLSPYQSSPIYPLIFLFITQHLSTIHPSFCQSAYYHLSILLCIHLTICPFTDLSSTHPVIYLTNISYTFPYFSSPITLLFVYCIYISIFIFIYHL